MGRGTGKNPLKDDVVVILHRTSIPENIGATARVMANMGFNRLILSEPGTKDLETARKVAVSAAGIVDQATVSLSLKEAAAASGASFLVGTTARDRKYQDPVDITAAAPEILRMASAGGAAILFGPEDRGLTNGELALCRMAVTIPVGGELASYNLSHAAAVVLFAVMTASLPAPSAPVRTAAGHADLEGMFAHLEGMLTQAGFLAPGNSDHMMQTVRKFLNRAEPTPREVRMIRGICRRLTWNLRKNGQ